jgi:hypothetical protein
LDDEDLHHSEIASAEAGSNTSVDWQTSSIGSEVFS